MAAFDTDAFDTDAFDIASFSMATDTVITTAAVTNTPRMVFTNDFDDLTVTCTVAQTNDVTNTQLKGNESFARVPLVGNESAIVIRGTIGTTQTATSIGFSYSNLKDTEAGEAVSAFAYFWTDDAWGGGSGTAGQYVELELDRLWTSHKANEGTGIFEELSGYAFFDSVSYKSFQLVITCNYNRTVHSGVGYLDVGRIILGNAFESEFSYDWGSSSFKNKDTRKTSGIQNNISATQNRQVTIMFPQLSDAERLDLATQAATIGKRGDILLGLEPLGTDAIAKEKTFLARRVSDLKTTRVGHNINTSSITFVGN